MNAVPSKLRQPAIIGSALVLPFMILEWINRRNYHEEFPIVLFRLMWLLPAAFTLILTPTLRNARAGNSIMPNPIGFWLSVALLIFIAWMWAGLILDQLPCFLGVPNCD